MAAMPIQPGPMGQSTRRHNSLPKTWAGHWSRLHKTIIGQPENRQSHMLSVVCWNSLSRPCQGSGFNAVAAAESKCSVATGNRPAKNGHKPTTRHHECGIEDDRTASTNHSHQAQAEPSDSHDRQANSHRLSYHSSHRQASSNRPSCDTITQSNQKGHRRFEHNHDSGPHMNKTSGLRRSGSRSSFSQR